MTSMKRWATRDEPPVRPDDAAGRTGGDTDVSQVIQGR